MEILDCTRPSPKCFGDLPPRSVFKSTDDHIYMKLPYSVYEQPDEDADELNAIHLSTGDHGYFCFSEEVFEVEASLVIKPILTPIPRIR